MGYFWVETRLELQGLTEDGLIQLWFIFSDPGTISMEHFVQYDAQRPHVAFRAVVLASEHFWSCVVGAAEKSKLLRSVRVSDYTTVSEVSQLGDALVEEYVARLDVAMYDLFREECRVTSCDVSKKEQSLSLAHAPWLGSDIVLEISILAVLEEQIYGAHRAGDLHAEHLDYVGRTELLHVLELVFDLFHQLLVDVLHTNLLDGHQRTVPVPAQHNSPHAALAQWPLRIHLIVSHLHHLRLHCYYYP